MTTATLAYDTQPRALPVPLVLGLQEGRRIAGHPIALLGAALTVTGVLVVGDDGPRDAFDVLSTGPTFFYGVFVFFAAHLVASRDRRAHSSELLAATPAPVTDRVAALCLGAVVPAALAGLFVAAAHAMQTARDLYVVAPGAWHLAQGPLTVLGGALLGVMVARLTSLPGAALLVMVAMVAADVALSNESRSLHPLSTYVTWAQWGDGSEWVGLIPGSPFWHAVYLACLCAMAATGAFLREARERIRVLCAGGACTAAAIVSGLLSLP